MFLGGFVWECVDQTPNKWDGEKRFFAYGGDYGDQPHDGDIAKGLVSPDRIPHPGSGTVIISSRFPDFRANGL